MYSRTTVLYIIIVCQVLECGTIAIIIFHTLEDFMVDKILLLIAPTIALITLIISRYFQTKVPTYLFVIMLVLIVGSAIFSGFSLAKKQNQVETNWSQNTLTPRIVQNIQYPTISLGTSKLQRATSSTNTLPFINLGNGTYIDVWLEDSNLKLSLILRNEKGEQIARIDANRFIVTKDSSYDCNYDSTALEVTHSGKVMLQVQMKDGVALVQGVFYNIDGACVVLGYNQIQTFPPGTTPTYSFNPIFRYPSYKYFGGRVSYP